MTLLIEGTYCESSEDTCIAHSFILIFGVLRPQPTVREQFVAISNLIKVTLPLEYPANNCQIRHLLYSDPSFMLTAVQWMTMVPSWDLILDHGKLTYFE